MDLPNKQMIDTLTGQPGKRADNIFPSTKNAVAACRVLNHEKFGRRLVFIELDFDDNDSAIFQLVHWLPKP